MKTPIISKLLKSMENQIDTMSPDERAALISEAKRLTSTNCGWREYHIGDVAGNYACWIEIQRQSGKAGDPHV